MDIDVFSEKLSQNVSRETWDKLLCYSELLLKWQKKINLVSNSTLNNVWERHILDSAQLLQLIDSKDNGKVIDFGSGAGFPALVLSVFGVENVFLIESDRRKCSFLREVIRSCDLSSTVINDRIENVKLENVSLITARALSSLSELFGCSYPFLGGKTKCLFLKGRNIDKEIFEAEKLWSFSIKKIQSVTDADSFVVDVSNIKKK